MNEQEKYLELATEIIKKQSVILGPDIALLKARSISELQISDTGEVTSISGEANLVIEKLVDAYVALSGAIVKSALSSVFTRYPNLQQKVDNQ